MDDCGSRRRIELPKTKYKMNTIALNQTVLKKYAVVGHGFKGGEEKPACKTPRGYNVFINGFQELPEISKIKELFELGSFNYPDLLTGMGTHGGIIRYLFGITEFEYILIVGVKLDSDDSDEFAEDIASFVFKDRVPISESEHQENYSEIAGELLLAHFTHFIGEDNVSDFKSFVNETNSELLISVVDFYANNFEQEIKQTLQDATDEEKRIINEMNNLFGDNN
jgi:hypothetical protein